MCLLIIGCGEITPYRHVITTDNGNEIGLRCALVGGIPVMCIWLYETKVEVPVEVIVEVIVEKVVEVEKVIYIDKIWRVTEIVEIEKIVEVDKIVETIKTEYFGINIDIPSIVREVISQLPSGTTKENYNESDIEEAVTETIQTYIPTPTTRTTTPKETNTQVETKPTVVNKNPPIRKPAPIKVHISGNQQELAEDGGSVEVPTGKDGINNKISPGDNITPIEVRDNVRDNDHQHWAAYKDNDTGEIVVHLANKDTNEVTEHPKLEKGVGPDIHHLEFTDPDTGETRKLVIEEL